MTELQTTWGWLVAVYLFLGGLGAGAFCTTAFVSLVSGERFKPTVRFGAWLSVSAIAVGTLFLLLETGKPLRALVLFKSFVNFSSWMTIGAWLIFAAILLDGLFALYWTDWVVGWLGKLWRPLEDRQRVIRAVLAVIGIPLNLAVALYTGMLLGVLPFRPFWNTWLLPVLFTASALSTGGVCICAYEHLRDGGRRVNGLVRSVGVFHLVLIVIEVVFWIAYLVTMLNGTPDMVYSARILIGGTLAPVFWIVLVGLGLAIPFCVHTLQLGLRVRLPRAVFLLSIATALIGGFALRFLVLSAGTPQAIASPALDQILQGGVTFLP